MRITHYPPYSEVVTVKDGEKRKAVAWIWSDI